MILYFDNLLTNQTLGTHYHGLDKVRKSNTVYKEKLKKIICSYSLYSYSKLKFDFSLINIKTENKRDLLFVKDICAKNFKNKILINNFRSDNKKSFDYSLKTLKKFMIDEWIFVMGNIDHPLITSDLNYVYKAVKFANTFKKKSKYISIMLSHQVEYLNMCNKNLVMPNIQNFPYKQIHECENYIVLKSNKGCVAHTLSTQIMNYNMLSTLIETTNFNKKKIFRTDEMNNKTLTNHIMIVPKNKICDHYDGYSHIKKWGHYLSCSKYPPLFIPKNFFSKKFNIYYGFKNRKKDGVNINPIAKKYSFQDRKFGTDLKIGLHEIPYFWKSKIDSIKKNKNANYSKINLKIKENKIKLLNPFDKKNILFIKIYLNFPKLVEKIKNLLRD
jgi:hypothetical protein